MVELVTVGLVAIIVGLDGRTMEAPLVTGIGIDVVDEAAVAVLVVEELATRLTVE